MLRHRLVFGSFALFSMLLLGGRAQTAIVNPNPTLSVVRSATIAGPNFVADFNGDGLPDVAGNAPIAQGANVSKVRVALGIGRAGFQTPIDTTFDGEMMGVGDVNGDGKVDLLVASSGQADDFLAVLPGNGDGTFGASRFIAFTSRPTFAQVADLDGDGKADVVVVNGDGDRADVLPGHGDFTFGTAVSLTTGFVPNGAVVADLNGDGRPDIVVANEHRSLSVFLNQGALTFTASDIPIDRMATGVTAADVNGDGTVDLVATAADATESAMGRMYTAGFVYVFSGRGDGTFAAPAALPVAPGAYRVVVGDFTRDGVLDIATVNFSTVLIDCGIPQKTWDSLSILPGVGGGAFGAANNFSIGNQMNLFDPRYRNSTTTLTAVDLNGDGALDLYTATGVFFLNQPQDPNWPPTVDLGPDQTINVSETTIGAQADDVDQDMLTYSWTSSDGTTLPPVPVQCLGSLSNGSHTYTVTVDDGHGHQATDSITVNVNTGGGGGATGPTMTLTAPAAGETITAGTPYTIKFHIDDPDMLLYEWSIDYSLDNGATFSHIWECHNAGQSSGPGIPTSRDASCTWMNPGPASSQALIMIYAQDDADAPIGTPSSVRFSIAPQPGGVPYPWQHQDIGAVAKAGTTTFAGGVFSVSGSGADIWGTADEFQYAYLAQPDRGTVTILEAHVDSVQNVAPWTKAGVMFRDSLNAGSRQASIFVTPGKGIAFQRRLTQGGSSVSTAGPLITAPVWLRLTMFPNTGGGVGFRAYYRKTAADPWTLVGQDATPTFWNAPAAGLAVSSHVDGTLATATFSSARAFAGGDWRSNSIGAPGGKAIADDTLFTVTGIGADIWGTSDQFEFVYQDCVGDCTITAHVRDVQNVNAWTKAGVMFRHTPFTGESVHVDAIVSPSKGVAMQYRAIAGGTSASAGTLAGLAPGWLRLTRRGNTFTSFWSTDGVHFTQIGSVSVVMNTGVSVGLAVTSHNATTPATATFDSVTIQQP